MKAEKFTGIEDDVDVLKFGVDDVDELISELTEKDLKKIAKRLETSKAAKNPANTFNFWRKFENLKMFEAYQNQVKLDSTGDLMDVLIDTERKNTDRVKYRILNLAISFELSNRGIAPKWQGAKILDDYDDDIETCNHWFMDSIIADLYFLFKEFPKHKTQLKKWQPIFDRFSIDAALAVCKRSGTIKDKRKLLGLSDFQCLGLVAFRTIKAMDAHKRAMRAATLECKKRVNHLTIEDLQQTRNDVVYSAKAALYSQAASQYSPTDTAKVFKWKTGRSITKQAASSAINLHLNKPTKRELQAAKNSPTFMHKKAKKE